MCNKSIYKVKKNKKQNGKKISQYLKSHISEWLKRFFSNLVTGYTNHSMQSDTVILNNIQ